METKQQDQTKFSYVHCIYCGLTFMGHGKTWEESEQHAALRLAKHECQKVTVKA